MLPLHLNKRVPCRQLSSCSKCAAPGPIPTHPASASVAAAAAFPYASAAAPPAFASAAVAAAATVCTEPASLPASPPAEEQPPGCSDIASAAVCHRCRQAADDCCASCCRRCWPALKRLLPASPCAGLDICAPNCLNSAGHALHTSATPHA
jgi:hypothetical protein